MLATLGCLGRVHTRPVFTALCTMCVSLLDHRLQHGCPGRAKGALCVLSAAMDYPAQDHPAWGRCFSIPLLPAAAEPGRRRWIISSLLHIAPELFTIQLRNISNKILVCGLTLLAEGRRGLCKHHFAPEEADCQLKHWLRFNSFLCYFNIYQFLSSSSESWYPYVAFFTYAVEHSSWVFGKKILVLQFRWCSAQVLCK